MCKINFDFFEVPNLRMSRDFWQHNPNLLRHLNGVCVLRPVYLFCPGVQRCPIGLFFSIPSSLAQTIPLLTWVLLAALSSGNQGCGWTKRRSLFPFLSLTPIILCFIWRLAHSRLTEPSVGEVKVFSFYFCFFELLFCPEGSRNKRGNTPAKHFTCTQRPKIGVVNFHNIDCAREHASH